MSEIQLLVEAPSAIPIGSAIVIHAGSIALEADFQFGPRKCTGIQTSNAYLAAFALLFMDFGEGLLGALGIAKAHQGVQQQCPRLPDEHVGSGEEPCGAQAVQVAAEGGAGRRERDDEHDPLRQAQPLSKAHEPTLPDPADQAGG